MGLGPVEVRVPRVAQVPGELAPQGYHSGVVQRYQRASQTTQRLFARLYLEGLATGDFEPVFRELVGETTALSANTVVRLKEHWGQEYRDWQRRPLGQHRYAYIWADGIYLAAGTEQEKTALLRVLGAREDGEKELIAMAPGYRESTESWAEALRDLRDRGLAPPLLAVGDGALGLWAALDQVFPNTEHQRCWNHRVLNVRSKLPKRLQAEVRGRLREMTESETQALCEERRDAYVAELRSEGQGAAAETVLRDWEDFATFYLSQRTLGAPANQQPHRVHLQRGKTADRRGQAYTLPGECPLPGVQDGGAPQRKLADVERRREPDGPGLGGM